MVNLRKLVFIRRLQKVIYIILISLIGEERYEKVRFKKFVGYIPNFKNPETLNEKLAWLKIHYLQDYYYEACDKYTIRDFLKKVVGKDYAPPLLFVTKNPKDLNFNNIKVFPCIIKTSNGSGSNLIVKDKTQFSESFLQQKFALEIELSNIHTVTSLEHQYVKKNPFIVVERLLHDEKGGIPNDYKVNCINGEIEFIYCSVDRLGANVRHVYDKNWNRLHFAWVNKVNEDIFNKYESTDSIPVPKHFSEMKELAKSISSLFPYVRVDFYDTPGGLFIGEITLHHGSGHDTFYPSSFDSFYGKKLTLPHKNR